MKKIFIFLFFLTSITSFGQTRFLVPKDKSLIRNYQNTQDNHFIILKSYREQIESELKRLIEGIEFETGNHNSSKAQLLKIYFSELVLKNIIIHELEKQLSAINLDQHLKEDRRRPVFKTENLNLNLQEEINRHLTALNQTGLLSEYLMHDLAKTFKEETLKASGKKVFQSLGGGLLTKIMTQRLTSAALKSAVISIGSEAFVSAGYSVIMSILTIPLHGYRLPPEHIWTDILKKNPEIIINPEWMKYAGAKDEPWFSHGYALLRRTKVMEERLNDLLLKEEQDFVNRIQIIMRLDKPINNEDDFHERKDVAVRDATYVYMPKPYLPSLPFWAIKK
jgi:hypothetical protein